jgi:hypothetical protein
MKEIRVMMILISFLAPGVMAQSGKAAENAYGIAPIVNEISLYQNSADDGTNLGQTLQIISINEIRLGTTFNLEFTADFNRKMTPGEDTDYYIEIGLVKPVWKSLSANYQRIHGTFISDPVNQFGLRWSF